MFNGNLICLYGCNELITPSWGGIIQMIFFCGCDPWILMIRNCNWNCGKTKVLQAYDNPEMTETCAQKTLSVKDFNLRHPVCDYKIKTLRFVILNQ